MGKEKKKVITTVNSIDADYLLRSKEQADYIISTIVDKLRSNNYSNKLFDNISQDIDPEFHSVAKEIVNKVKSEILGDFIIIGADSFINFEKLAKKSKVK